MDNSVHLAAQGRALLQEAVLIALSEGALSNAEIAQKLELCSDHEGSDKNYLTWMVLGDLLRLNKVGKRRTIVEGTHRKRTEFFVL
jgi:hypothetical protein